MKQSTGSILFFIKLALFEVEKQAIFFSCNQQRKEKKGRKRRKKRREEREKKRRRESSTTPRTNSMCLRSVAPLAHTHAHSRVHAMRPRSHTTIYAKHSKQLVTSDRRYCRLSLVLPVSRSNSTPPLLLFRRFNRFPLCRYSRRRCRRRLPLWWRCRRRRRRRRTLHLLPQRAFSSCAARRALPG